MAAGTAALMRPQTTHLELSSPRSPLWVKVTLGITLGYLLLGRTFAYLGLPLIAGGLPPVYVGEVMLAALVVVNPAASPIRIFEDLRAETPTSGVAWAMYALLVYGVFQAARGWMADYSTTGILQLLAFNMYPLSLYLGLRVGEVSQGILPRFIALLAWTTGVYGLLYVAVLSRTSDTLPGAPGIPLFGKPWGAGVALLGVLAFKDHLRNARFLQLISLAVLITSITRAHWAGALIALPLWGVLSKRLRTLVAVFAGATVLLMAAWVLELSFSTGEGTAYSARTVASAAVAPFDEQLAASFSEDEVAHHFAGTSDWRETWWRGIWESSNADLGTFAIGHGYGFQLVTTAELQHTDPTLRTPHNLLFFLLGYGGWVGVAIYVWFVGALFRILWLAYKRTGNPFGMVVLTFCLTVSMFTNFMETPFAAIPTFVIVGIAAAPAAAGLRS